MQLKVNANFKHLNNALLGAFLLVLTNSSYAEEPNSTLDVSGYVTATSANGDVKRIKSGDTLIVGDKITTGDDSTISITLANGEVIKICELSSYNVGDSVDGNVCNESKNFGNRSLNTQPPTLSTATSAGGRIDTSTPPEPATPVTPVVPPAPVTPPAPMTPPPAPTTPPPGGSPT